MVINKKITNKKIATISECFNQIDTFSLTRETQSKVINRCMSLIKEIGKLKSKLKVIENYINSEK
jgi:hypothetical protein